MGNANYRRGSGFERELVNAARKEGKISGRSAGSHSSVDYFIIDLANRKIEFGQCKVIHKENQASQFNNIKDKFYKYSGTFDVNFTLRLRLMRKNRKRK